MGTLRVGRAGSGKTDACLRQLAESLDRGDDALMLVPTYGQAEHLRLRLVRRLGGVTGRPVETFSSLAERRTGLRLSDLVAPAVRDRVAADVLAGIFPEAAHQPGFRLEFLAAVKEIREQGEDLDELVERARVHFPADSRGLRLFEACRAFVEALPGPDHETLLVRARDSLRRDPERPALLLVDGFHDFTAIQRQTVEALAAGAGEAVVTLPGDPDDPGHPLFATAARTAAALPADLRRRTLPGNRRAEGTLARLERVLFAPADDEPQPAADLEVLACASVEDEADRLARLVADSGRPPGEFLLLRRRFDGEHATWRAAFARHGVPLRFHGREPVAGWPATRAAVLWLRRLAGRLPLSEALPLLRSPWLRARPPAAEVDALARHLREHGEPEDLAGFPGVAAALAPPGERLSDAVRALDVGPALVGHPDGDDEVARAARLFDHLRLEAAAHDDLPRAEGADSVARRLPLLRLAAPDRRDRCVHAVEAREARQWEQPVVLVSGLGADTWPQPVRQDLFLRDDERRELAERHDVHLPLRVRREEEERYLFYVALTRARERMVLSWPAFDEEGNERPPSPFLEEALGRFRDVPVRRVKLAEQYVRPADARTRRDLLPIVADGVARAHREAAPLAVALHDRGAVDRDLLAWPRRLELLRARPLAGVPEAAARRLSASALNRYLRCPYLFLLDRVLDVERPRERELDPLLRGSIVHEALERAFREPARDAGEVFDAIFERETAPFRRGLDLLAQRASMRAVVVRAAAEMRGAPVDDVEVGFELPVGDARLRGRIDRIDRHPEGEIVRDYKTGEPKLAEVQAFENVQLDAYLLARPDAVGAVFDRLRKGTLCGFVLDEFAERAGGGFRGRSVARLTRAQLEERRGAMRDLVARVAAAVRAGRLAVAPRDPASCTRGQCDGFDACRVHRARWLARAARGGREWN